MNETLSDQIRSFNDNRGESLIFIKKQDVKEAVQKLKQKLAAFQGLEDSWEEANKHHEERLEIINEIFGEKLI